MARFGEGPSTHLLQCKLGGGKAFSSESERVGSKRLSIQATILGNSVFMFPSFNFSFLMLQHAGAWMDDCWLMDALLNVVKVCREQRQGFSLNLMANRKR